MGLARLDPAALTPSGTGRCTTLCTGGLRVRPVYSRKGEPHVHGKIERGSTAGEQAGGLSSIIA
jgi:hypothetical protein